MNPLRNRQILGLLLCVFVLSWSALAQPKPTQPVRVTLLQVNDVYQTSPVDRGKAGGLARIAALRKQIQAESPHTLLLLAGDTISPSVASSIFRGKQIIAAWNAAGLDYAALGNHEFDFGNDVLIERMKESKFVWLGANVIDRKTNQSFNAMPPYVVRTFDGVKVGLFGLLTTETQASSKPGANLRFVNPIFAARSTVRKLRAQGVKVIVAITHLSLAEDKALARAVPELDVIIGGHEHELLQSHAGKTPIFKWGQDARLLGQIDLNINKRTRRVESLDWKGIPVNDAVTPDPAAAAVIKEYEDKLSAELDQPVGSTSVELDGRSSVNRSLETNLGNFVADAFRQNVNADVALINGGSIRVNAIMPVGKLTKRDAIAVMPFENPIVKVEVSGAILKAALENGVSRIVEEAEAGRFPQVSGLTFSYDARRPAGSRVVEVKVNGNPLDEQKKYTVASTAYLFEGGDGYKMFANAKYLVTAESAAIDSAVLIQAFGAGAIAPKVEGRITRLN
jgi:5'-nucleotidase